MRVATGLMRLCGITLPGKGSRQYVEPVLPLHGSVGTLPQGRVVNGSKMLMPYLVKCWPPPDHSFISRSMLRRAARSSSNLPCQSDCCGSAGICFGLLITVRSTPIIRFTLSSPPEVIELGMYIPDL